MMRHNHVLQTPSRSKIGRIHRGGGTKLVTERIRKILESLTSRQEVTEKVTGRGRIT